MKISAGLPLTVSSNEIDGHHNGANQKAIAIKECGSNVASTNSPVSVVVPGVHLTLWRGAIHIMAITEALPRATSTEAFEVGNLPDDVVADIENAEYDTTESSGQKYCDNHQDYATAQE